MIISLAPLQSYTEFPFRNALNNIGGIDKFYTPFIRYENNKSIKNKHIKDILPENNKNINLTPQVLTNNSEDFINIIKIVNDLGYNKINWNLGCPFPMVTKRKMGAGLLPYPEQVYKILEDVMSKTNTKISIKLRSGYTDNTEIYKIIETLNNFKLEEIILHPRIAKQMYKGVADINIYTNSKPLSLNKIAYNGDINSIEKYEYLKNKLPNTNHFMIGRALISNPFLALEIKTGKKLNDLKKRELFAYFYNSLFEYYSQSLSGKTHILNKLLSFWGYFSLMFIDNKKIIKTLKKSKTIEIFNHNTAFFINNNEFKQS